jgi:hypothetical protein
VWRPGARRAEVLGLPLLRGERQPDPLRPAVVLMMLSGTAAVVVVQPGTALPTELPEHDALRAGLEPATCRIGVDNRAVPARSREVRRGHELRSGRGVEPHRRSSVQPLSPDNRAAPARDDLVDEAGLPGVEPGPARLELAVLPFTPQAYRERTTRIERASPEWRPGALPSELRPRSGTPGWSRTSGLCRRRTALSPLSYGRRKEPPAGVEPAPRPYKGRVLAVDTTEA